GHLSVVEAVALGDIGKVELIPADKVLAHLPRVEVDAAIAEQARNGRVIPSDAVGERVLVAGPDGAIGIFTATNDGLRPVTVLGR
ncbi:MAG: hypothetical protein ACRDKJ_07505, partial [Actinomycetota bacterium]